MLDVEEVIEMLSKLSYEEALAYWIKSEREEAEFYRQLAERARNLGLPESLVEAFEKLSKDSERHAGELTRLFRESYSKEPESDIPPIEVLSVLEKFERADQTEEVLRTAMESELIAMNAYKTLAEKVEDPKLKELYLKLANVEKTHYEILKGEYEKLGG
ncbi:ferritin family protein [Thermococcus sp.]|uniref:ferritin family protein n=1 Tax=Thermococcus sp. TaxID=35749 RepID=UPI002630E777|nr:ferritin family protein [Thermococcus sp.]